MAEMVVVGESIRDQDWYGEDLTGRCYVDCDFRDVDLTEVSGNPTFQDCRLSNCRLNAARLAAAAFVGSELRRTSFWGATLDGCKLAGSVFVECVLRPMTVTGGHWARGDDARR